MTEAQDRPREIRGLDFVPDPRAMPSHEPGFARQVRALLAPMMDQRLDGLLGPQAPRPVVRADGLVCVDGVPLGALRAGPDLYQSRLRPLRHDLLTAAQRTRVETWLGAWKSALLQTVLGPLRRPAHSQLDRPGHAIYHHILQGLGSSSAGSLRALISELEPGDHKRIAQLGVRLGHHHVYCTDLLHPAAVQARALLWALHQRAPVPQQLPSGASAPRNSDLKAQQCTALGYALPGPRMVRHDMLERLSAWARGQSRRGSFTLQGPALEWIGCPRADAPGVFSALGYRPVDPAGMRWQHTKNRRPRKRR